MKSRVVRGRIEVWVPHKDKEIAFAHPSVGPGTYRNDGLVILKAEQRVSVGDDIASLLHAAYCENSVANEPEFVDVRNIMDKNWLWVFNKNLWTDKGVYVLLDLDATGRSQSLDINTLEKMLNGGSEINGVRVSKDERLRFAPRETYNLGEHTPESLAKDGFIIASCGLEGAKKLGETSAKFRNNPCTYGIKIEKKQTPELRVSAVDGGDGTLWFIGYDWDDYYCSHAFGVWK